MLDLSVIIQYFRMAAGIRVRRLLMDVYLARNEVENTAGVELTLRMS